MNNDFLEAIAYYGFDIQKLTNFFCNKNRAFEEQKANFKEDKNFKAILKLGEINFPEEGQKLIVCSLKSQAPLSERSSKKNQYEKGKAILKELGFSAGIFIFYDKNRNFRFSLIYANYKGKNRDWSSKRFTYFVEPRSVNPHVTNKTFLQQIGNGDFSSLEGIKAAFSVEKVNKDFYKDISNWYFWAVQHSKFPKSIELENNGRNIAIIRLITRLMFIWFMRERGLIPKDLFEKEKLTNYLKNVSPKESTYYKGILQNLFFAVLNTQQRKRKFKPETFEDHDHQNVFHYHKLFKKPASLSNYFGEIPFLNGGLFECLDDKSRGIYIDGFTEEKKNQSEIPNFLFFSDEKEKVRGLIDILASYNFTIDENDPHDAEIALDPELLGKVFENLLASFNPETASTARKTTGSYYTPREIVDYMVTQSLKEYFKTHLKNTQRLDEKINTLFERETEPLFSVNESNEIIELIDHLRIVDPSVGSGAFPMGILNKLVFVLNKLDPKNVLWKEAQIKAIKNSKINLALKEKQIEQTNNQFKNKNINYVRKLYLIQKCIYGVDIQQIAVEIAKLRFFISLLVDEKIDYEEKNLGIEPLPNLDFKIMQGNSLISEFMGIDFDNGNHDKEQAQTGLLFAEDDNSLIKKFEQKKIDFQNEADKDKKANLKKEVEDLMIQIFETKVKKQKGDYFRQTEAIESKYSVLPNQKQREKIVAQEKQKLSKKSGFDLDNIEKQLREFTSKKKDRPFFPWKVYFAEVFEKGGFDVVIGNPPYIQLQKMKGNPIQQAYRDQKYEVHDSNGDLYCLFYEKGLNLLKIGGTLSYITSNKWMRTGYGEKLRSYFIKHTPLILIDLGPGVFESAMVDTNILLIKKGKNEAKGTLAVTLVKKANEPPDIASFLKENGINLNNLTKDAWFIGTEAEQKLKEKIERIGKPLKEWDVSINYGIKTGLNEAFIIDQQTRDRLVAEDPKSAEILKKVLGGKNLINYTYNWAGLWVIATFPALHVNIDKYPAVKKYLLNFGKERLVQEGKKLANGSSSRKKTGNKWFETQDQIAYYPEFAKEKVVWLNLNRKWKYSYVDKGIFVEASLNFLSSDKHIKFYTGVLSSNIHLWYFKRIGRMHDTGGFMCKIDTISSFPIPPITSENRPIVAKIESHVDEILALKKGNGGADTSVLEKQVDQMVYDLYELTDKEIQVIEKTLKETNLKMKEEIA